MAKALRRRNGGSRTYEGVPVVTLLPDGAGVTLYGNRETEKSDETCALRLPADQARAVARRIFQLLGES